MKNKKKFYITTAIVYSSKLPHVGNLYDPLFADVIARFKRLAGYDVFFLTGTDEHGQKILNTANELKMFPKQYVDKISSAIRETYLKLNISFDKFFRTTDQSHINKVQEIFLKLYENGNIYKGKYQGWYCTACESFWPNNQVENCKCPECKREVKLFENDAYFLKLSKYQSELSELLNKNIDLILPHFRKKEIINNFLNEGLEDLCITRVNCNWGIPVPFDPEHTIYVWFDALLNYITALDFPSGELYNKYWPPDVQIVGKDILRFHSLCWPVLLICMGVSQPQKIFAHPWILINDAKMSKSSKNEIYVESLIEMFGVDATRYLLLAETSYDKDASLNYDILIQKYNSDLVNDFGNLINRVATMAIKYLDGFVSNPNFANRENDKNKNVNKNINETGGFKGHFLSLNINEDGDVINDWGEEYEDDFPDENDYSDNFYDSLEDYEDENNDNSSEIFKLGLACGTAIEKFLSHMESLNVQDALKEVSKIVKDTNKYIDLVKPWSMAKSSERSQELEAAIYNMIESLREVTHLLASFMPDTAEKIAEQFDFKIDFNNLKFGSSEKFKVKESDILFKRIIVDTKNPNNKKKGPLKNDDGE